MCKKVFLILTAVAIAGFGLLSGGCKKFQKEDQLTGYRVDLNHDGKNEIIRVNKLKVEVFSQDKIKLGDFELFDLSDKLEFIDLNKNGQKQIAVWSQGKEGFSQSLAIYGLKNKNLYEIFKVEASGRIETGFNALLPWIRSGWTTWIWNGEQFVQK